MISVDGCFRVHIIYPEDFKVSSLSQLSAVSVATASSVLQFIDVLRAHVHDFLIPFVLKGLTDFYSFPVVLSFIEEGNKPYHQSIDK